MDEQADIVEEAPEVLDQPETGGDRHEVEFHEDGETRAALELYKLGHWQLLATMRKRDRFLYLNLVAQATLLALSIGISIGLPGASSAPHPAVLIFAIPFAVTFALLYVVEDGAVTALSRYLSTIYRPPAVRNWSFEASPELGSFLPFVWIRLVAQLVAFCLIPSALVFVAYPKEPPYPCLDYLGIGLAAAVLMYGMGRKSRSMCSQIR